MGFKKQSGGVEDLTFGMGTEEQLRKGGAVTIEQINSNDIPFTATVTVEAELNRQDSVDEALRIDVDSKPETTEVFLKAEHLNVSRGPVDAGLPIVLDSDGRLHPSITGLGAYLVGYFTPTSPQEYPDTTGYGVGAYWQVDGVPDPAGYTFTGGSLVGLTIYNGEAMLLGEEEWVITSLMLEDGAYYKRDGEFPITEDFQADGHKLLDVADGVDSTDGVNKGQLDTVQADTDTKSEWKGTWVAGTYDENDMVLDNNWLMIANKQTSDTAAPTTIGDSFTPYGGTSPTAPHTAKQIIFGNRYTFNIAGWLNAYRVYTIIGNDYRISMVSDPEGEPVIDTLISFRASVTGWVDVSINQNLIPANSTIDMVVTVDEPDPTPTVLSTVYDYTTPQNSGSADASGEMIQSRSTPSIMNINYTDANLVGRETAMKALSPGDIIVDGDTRWSIQANTDKGVYAEFVVSPAINGSSGNGKAIDFETTAATPTTIVEDTDYWLSNPLENGIAYGLFIVDGPYSSIAVNNTAYGIDITVQAAYASPDWDAMSYTGTTGGGDGSNDYISSSIGAIAGASQIANEVVITQTDYDALTPNESTVYFIPEV